MELKQQTYEYSTLLGWSLSRYELFSKCKRQYFYNYYSKYVPDVPLYKLNFLKSLTSVPLEIGNVVHDVLASFLRRLQKSTTKIDEQRFFTFSQEKTNHYFSSKTFIETYYGVTNSIDIEKAFEKIKVCLSNFIISPCYSWIFMKALVNRENWLIEPNSYGETRLEGIKAYCKMDFLFPVDGEIHILDWKTGVRDCCKHTTQLLGYAAAASTNFLLRWDKIFPRIIYLYPKYDELEVSLDERKLKDFILLVKQQSQQMYGYCKDIENNVPLPIEAFVPSPSPQICSNCNFREICPAMVKLKANNGQIQFVNNKNGSMPNDDNWDNGL